MTVEEDLSISHKIDGGGWHRGTRIRGTKVEPIVVSGANSAVNLTLENPDEFFDGVVEVEAEFVVGVVAEDNWFRALVLGLIN